MPIYIGVGGKARKVKVAYIGDSQGNAQVIYKSGVVPDGYIPVEYIYNNHSYTNYIDTGIIPNSYTRIIVKFKLRSTAINDRGILGTGSGIGYMGIINDNSNTYHNLDIYNGENIGSIAITADTIVTIDINRTASKNSYYKLGSNSETSLSIPSNNVTTSNSIYLFGASGSNIYSNNICIYSCAIYQSMLNGTLSKNYIPCIRTSDGRVGMWESVGGSFNTGSNTNSDSYFTSGPVIES